MLKTLSSSLWFAKWQSQKTESLQTYNVYGQGTMLKRAPRLLTFWVHFLNPQRELQPRFLALKESRSDCSHTPTKGWIQHTDAEVHLHSGDTRGDEILQSTALPVTYASCGIISHCHIHFRKDAVRDTGRQRESISFWKLGDTAF